MNILLLSFLIFQSIVSITTLYISINTMKKLKHHMKNKSNITPNIPTINAKIIKPIKLNSINSNEQVTIDAQDKEYIIAFVTPGCTACKDLFDEVILNRDNNKKLIAVTHTDVNIDDYKIYFKERNIPLVLSEKFAKDLEVRAFPTVIYIDNKLNVKGFFIGSNKPKLTQFINAA